MPLCPCPCLFWPLFPSLRNSFTLQGATLTRLPDWLGHVEVGNWSRLVGGSSTCCPPGPMNLLARLEPAAIWNAGLFMEPGGCSPGPDPANLEAISSWAKGY